MTEEGAHSEEGTHSEEGGLGSYLTGFFLSLILTGVAFWLVAERAFSVGLLYVYVAVLALLQLFVQSRFFLHLNTSSDRGRVNLLSFVLTLLVVATVAGGSLWVMYHLGYNTALQ